MSIDATLINSYIIKNAPKSVIKRAKNCKPHLIFKSNNLDSYIFKCKSSDDLNMYNVQIELVNGQLETKCTCPYTSTFLMVCKHVVASLNMINISQNKQLTIDLENLKEQSKLKHNEIFLKDELLVLSNLEKYVVRQYSYGSYVIESLELPKIVTKYDGYYIYKQTFMFKKETSSVEFECNCSSYKSICEHIYYALDSIIDICGENIFKENYFQTQKEEALKRYGFAIEDNAEELFSFSLTENGFEAKPHFKNIQIHPIDITSISKEGFDFEKINLPLKLYEDKINALCFLISFSKNKFEYINVCTGKMNKAKTDISSSIEVINNYNKHKFIQYYNNKEDQNFILKSTLLLEIMTDNINILEVESMKFCIELIMDILPRLKNTFIYIHSEENSYIRKNLQPVTISEKKVQLFFDLTENDFFYTLKAKIKIDEEVYTLSSKKLKFANFFILIEDELIVLNDVELIVYLAKFFKEPEINFRKKTIPDFHEKVIYPLAQKFEINTKLINKIKKKEKTESNQYEKHIYIKDIDAEYITFNLAIQYPEKLINVLSPDKRWIENEDNTKIKYIERDEAYENESLEQFKSLNPAFENQERGFYLAPNQLFENYWILHVVEKMKQFGFKVFGANDLKSFKYNIHKPNISVCVNQDMDWFDITINISFGDQKVSLKEVQKAFLKKTNYIQLGDGTIGILPEDWMKKFKNYFKTGEIKRNTIQLSNFQFGIIDELYNELDTKPAFLKELYEKKKRLQNISIINDIKPPKGIKATLRDYQLQGLNWLAFLDKNQLGGCLADDMGLGKTLQTISFLQYCKLQDKKHPPSLIIAPTSLIFNWNNEIERFCPSLKLLTFTGIHRAEKFEKFDKYDIIISTYGSLLNDIEIMKDFKFHYVILDESQAIKNPNSKRYKAVKLLQSFNRIVLTGTPIENNTFDLYAQLNFLNPGLLGTMSHFKNQFSDAIDKDKDVTTSNLLNRMINPFVLRRTKQQVATELPEKTESIIYCEMDKEQRNVYEHFKNQYRDYLLNKIDENGIEKSQMYILEGLTRLRQICNSTAMISDEEDYGNFSIKLQILIENIKEKTGNHKILVFSQFVKMLQIVKNELDSEQILYEYLDGQTTNRQEKVENFQNNSNIRVFLISLKAGGTGLNLTEADYVFIIDPWWNPAVENQAIDRCYRIGQTKKVMAYRMICKDTIEEKIISLQSKKKAVATSIISIDEDKKSFDVNEVKSLFK
jgi:SNF2 family DNA or RNA helicase